MGITKAPTAADAWHTLKKVIPTMAAINVKMTLIHDMMNASLLVGSLQNLIVKLLLWISTAMLL
jgi:hypothetical protein